MGSCVDKISVLLVSALVSAAYGTQQFKKFQKSWPSSFHLPVQKLVITGSIAKKHVHVGTVKVVDIDIIYSRVIGFQASSRQVDGSRVLSHKLSLIPMSMFTDYAEIPHKISSTVGDESFNKQHTAKHRLTITGLQEEPYEIYSEDVKRRHDLKNTCEEADTILVQQAILAADDVFISRLSSY
ncbi:hypothetical protein FQA39_LY12417 [Lamprigera yunnana]|nr:hypothetical protein FQA39_LY12417 [Lamprigera yunnana]